MYEKDFDHNLRNLYDYEFIGTMYVGSQFQEMTFLFDTGSDWIWIPDEACPEKQCPNHFFDKTKSKTFQGTQIVREINYVVGYANGTMSNDHFSMTKSVDT